MCKHKEIWHRAGDEHMHTSGQDLWAWYLRSSWVGSGGSSGLAMLRALCMANDVNGIDSDRESGVPEEQQVQNWLKSWPGHAESAVRGRGCLPGGAG